MTKFKKQIVSAAAAGAMLLNLATPALAGTEIVISGNGSGSDNEVVVSQTSNQTVTQNNTANVTNNVNADAKTGNNDANYNTGGDVTIDTGKATTNVDVNNVLNSNSADVDCCAPGDTNVKIDGNGAKSDNYVGLTQGSNTVVTQNNVANVINDVDADAKTGKNDANGNTGGEVTIKTGDAKADVSVSTVANVNSARIGSGNGSNPSASFIISGNGSGSDNAIIAALGSNTVLTQLNNADIDNDVDADAETGENDANYNTGGDVAIFPTGNATANVDVDNAVNFNSADVDCGCTFDVLAKITGNGADGDDNHWKWWDKDENKIGLTLASNQILGQGNTANLTNDVDADAETGENESDLNTGEGDSDPVTKTGNATSDTGVSNSGNVNTIGDFGFEMPDFPEVEFSFSFAAMMAFFGMSL